MKRWSGSIAVSGYKVYMDIYTLRLHVHCGRKCEISDPGSMYDLTAYDLNVGALWKLSGAC